MGDAGRQPSGPTTPPSELREESLQSQDEEETDSEGLTAVQGGSLASGDTGELAGTGSEGLELRTSGGTAWDRESWGRIKERVIQSREVEQVLAGETETRYGRTHGVAESWVQNTPPESGIRRAQQSGESLDGLDSVAYHVAVTEDDLDSCFRGRFLRQDGFDGLAQSSGADDIQTERLEEISYGTGVEEVQRFLGVTAEVVGSSGAQPSQLTREMTGGEIELLANIECVRDGGRIADYKENGFGTAEVAYATETRETVREKAQKGADGVLIGCQKGNKCRDVYQELQANEEVSASKAASIMEKIQRERGVELVLHAETPDEADEVLDEIQERGGGENTYFTSPYEEFEDYTESGNVIAEENQLTPDETERVLEAALETAPESVSELTHKEIAEKFGELYGLQHGPNSFEEITFPAGQTVVRNVESLKGSPRIGFDPADTAQVTGNDGETLSYEYADTRFAAVGTVDGEIAVECRKTAELEFSSEHYLELSASEQNSRTVGNGDVQVYGPAEAYVTKQHPDFTPSDGRYLPEATNVVDSADVNRPPDTDVLYHVDTLAERVESELIGESGGKRVFFTGGYTQSEREATGRQYGADGEELVGKALFPNLAESADMETNQFPDYPVTAVEVKMTTEGKLEKGTVRAGVRDPRSTDPVTEGVTHYPDGNTERGVRPAQTRYVIGVIGESDISCDSITTEELSEIVNRQPTLEWDHILAPEASKEEVRSGAVSPSDGLRKSIDNSDFGEVSSVIIASGQALAKGDEAGVNTQRELDEQVFTGQTSLGQY